MFHSIRWRLVLSYVILALITISVVGVLTLEIIDRHARQQERENLRNNARGVSQQATPLIWPIVQRDELSQLVETASFLGHLQVRILDTHQKPIVDSGDPRDSNLLVFLQLPGRPEFLSEIYPDIRVPVMAPSLVFLDDTQIETILAEAPPDISVTVIRRDLDPWGGRFTFQNVDDEGGNPIFITTSGFEDRPYSSTTILEPIINDDKLLGYVELSAAPDYGAEELDAVRQALIYAGGGAVLLAGIIGLWSSYRLTSPLHKLTETAIQMGSGDLSVRTPIHARDEIGKLATQFNSMAEQLENSFEQLASERDALRRFIGDASHELRTPITALKSFNTLLLDSAAEDPETRAEFLTESQAQLVRLEWITQTLLDLSRLDAGLLQLNLSDHHLADLIASASAVFELPSKDKGIIFTVQAIDSTIRLHCDRTRMELAISNLLDNALKFTPKGGQVEVSAETDQEFIYIRVRDTGIGIPVDSLAHIFERFYRGDNHQETGSGLGLSIVESVVKAHRGKIKVESVLGDGACFTLKLPRDGELAQDNT